jgi:hypothetical protein
MFKKYDWLNNPPPGLLKNLQNRAKSIRQPGDEEKFARLRAKIQPAAKTKKDENPAEIYNA